MKYLSRYICYLERGVLYGSTLGDGNNQKGIHKERIYYIEKVPDNQYNGDPCTKQWKSKGSTLQHSWTICAALLFVSDSSEIFSFCLFPWYSLPAFCLLLLIVSSKSQI